MTADVATLCLVSLTEYDSSVDGVAVGVFATVCGVVCEIVSVSDFVVGVAVLIVVVAQDERGHLVDICPPADEDVGQEYGS